MTKTMYPEADRTDHKTQQDAGRSYYPEVDMGGKEGVFKDGRPYKSEFWFDIDCGVYAITFFYSTQGIEDWEEEDHLGYVKEYDLSQIQDDKYKNRGAGITQIDDASGNKLWSVTFILRNG